MSFDMYRSVVFPALARLSQNDPEYAHTFALRCLMAAERMPWLMNLFSQPSDTKLRQKYFGVTFPNPVGLAAGFVKNAEIYKAVSALLGFGFVEVGTVVPRPQSGNPRPRIVRVTEQQSLINRMGFPSDGVDQVLARLRQQGNGGIPRGISIGPNKETVAYGSLDRVIEDFQTLAGRLGPYADYFVINGSSPNTPGLRTLLGPEALRIILPAVRRAAPQVPVLVKLSPDLADAEVDAFLEACEVGGAAGYICTNTTLSRPETLQQLTAEGGLSGPPLRTPMLRMVARVRKQLPNTVIIGVGSIDSPHAAQAAFKAGAHLVQLYTGLVYHGPMLVRKILAH